MEILLNLVKKEGVGSSSSSSSSSSSVYCAGQRLTPHYRTLEVVYEIKTE